MARSLKFRIKEEEELYYLCGENLRLCISICNNPLTTRLICLQEKGSLSDENWPALCEVSEPAGPPPKKGPMKPTPSQTSSTGNQSNSDSGGDDSSKENKDNGSTTSENGTRTPKKKGKIIRTMTQERKLVCVTSQVRHKLACRRKLENMKFQIKRGVIV